MIVGNAKITSDLVLLYILGIDRYDDLCLVLKLNQHFDLTVGSKAGENARRVEIVKYLTTEFKVESFTKKRNSLLYLRRLKLTVFVIIKSLSENFNHALSYTIVKLK